MSAGAGTSSGGGSFLERRWWRAALVALYLVLVLLPLLVAALQRHAAGYAVGYSAREFGKGFALVGIGILAMQFVLSARLRWMERPFGLDVVFRYHKVVAVLAIALVVSHPVLLAAGSGRWGLLYRFDQPWYILIAKLALLLLLVQAVTSLWRGRVRLGFERWRLLHNQAPAVFVLVFVHSRIVGLDVGMPPMQKLWWAMLGVVVVAYGYHKVVAPAIARRNAYHVAEVKRETRNVWTLRLEPPSGRRRFDCRPGQFHFIKLWRGQRGLPVEEHHFTISSSPTAPHLASTIKESGDFTATIGDTSAGDEVSVRGPYGRFSYVFRARDRHFVFIAGGIGITPLMSMLRHMRDTEADVEVLLLYGNRTESDIVFQQELEQIAGGERPRLRVVHVLSETGEGWQGETGYVDREKIQRFVGERITGRTYYVCGPPPMARKVIADLRYLGVPQARIEYERFSL